MNGKKLAIITARGGSKRIPRKNTKDFCGKPILCYSIEAAKNAGVFDEIMVSTEDEEIARLARSAGASVPFFRSARNAGDYASTDDVILEVLKSYEAMGQSFEAFCCLYPTAPFLSGERLRSAMALLEETDSVMPVVPFSYPPQRGLILDKNGYVRRQFPEYAKCGAGYVNAVQRYNLFNATPRLLIETLAIAALVFYMMAQILNGASVTDIVPQVTALGVAAMRLIPSANRINNYLTSISYFEPFFMGVSDNLQEEIRDESINYDEAAYQKKPEIPKLEIRDKIVLKDIVYKYPDSETLIFDHADMEIPIGKSVGIVGTSGAGKTTVVDILLGLLKLQGGEIFADGAPVKEHYRSFLKNVGYIPQTIFMIDSTIRKNVAFGYADEDIEDEMVWRALREAQLDEFVRGLPQGLDTGIGERGIRISGGQRQRIGIARALFEDPEVLVLDEATSALDNETEAAIMDSINRLHGKKTLIIIAHRLQTIEKCDMVYRVEKGKARRER